MNKMLRIIFPALAINLMLAPIVVLGEVTTYEGTMALHGSGPIWMTSFAVQGGEGKIQLKIPEALFEFIPAKFEAETPFDLTLGEYTLHVESNPSALAEFERVQPGDANCDDVVDDADLEAVAKALGADITWPHGTDWNQYNAYADFNVDSKVDAHDLVIVGQNYEGD